MKAAPEYTGSERIRRVHRVDTNSIIPHDVRRALRRYGITEIRQSWLNLGRECPHAALLDSINDVDGPNNRAAFFGSLCHLAISNFEQLEKHGQTQEFWSNIIEVYRDIDPRSVTGIDSFTDLASAMASPKPLGVYLSEALINCVKPIRRAGRILSIEERVEYLDGNDAFPVWITGTLDMTSIVMRVNTCITDMKSSGISGPFFGGSLQKQTDTIVDDRQLLHYGMLYALKHGKVPSVYGKIFPVNAVPYKIGEKKGFDRGDIWVNNVIDNPGRRLAAYAADMVETLRSWSTGGFYRSFPKRYGKNGCDTCYHRGSCVPDSAQLSTGIKVPWSTEDDE
jgi:hypothetical protein